MRVEVESSKASRHLHEIGEILSRGVELLLKSREEHIRSQNLEQAQKESDQDTDSNPIIELAGKFETISTADVIEQTGMTRSTARRRLSELVAQGALVSEGKGRGACYRLQSAQN